MPDTLETLLLQLAGMKHAAQAMVAAEYDDAAVWDFDGDNFIWLALEQSRDFTDHWTAGWLMKPGATAEFVIDVTCRTPIEAALALRTKMIKGE